MQSRVPVTLCLSFSLLITACQHAKELKRIPPTLVLWAWDRAEDLRFLKPGQAEVAGLMATIQLRDGQVEVWHRRLPLMVPPEIPMKAVVRLESDGSELPLIKDASARIDYIARELDAVQLDFDARQSQLGWYRELIRSLREPTNDTFGRRQRKVSITALATWCMQPQPWFQSKPSDLEEVVPMLFRMGPQRVELLTEIARRRDFAEGCRGTIGVSIDEPLPWYPPARRVYVFNPRRWTKEVFDEVCARWR